MFKVHQSPVKKRYVKQYIFHYYILRINVQYILLLFETCENDIGSCTATTQNNVFGDVRL